MDTLTITGVSTRFDGVYECDVYAMIADVTSPEALTGDEACYIQEQSKVRGNELTSAFIAGDFKFLMALAVVVLARHDKNLDVGVLMSQKIGAYRFHIGKNQEDDLEHPPTGEGEQPPTTSKRGGTSFSSPSVIPADPLAATGVPV